MEQARRYSGVLGRERKPGGQEVGGRGLRHVWGDQRRRREGQEALEKLRKVLERKGEV